MNAHDLVTTAENGCVVADSRKIADLFGKLHKNVLRAADTMLVHRPDLGLNFEPKVYDVINTHNGTKRHAARYDVTRTGFMLLVMGFTGAKALALKIEWIAAFDRMEAALREVATAATPALGDRDEYSIFDDIIRWKAALQHVREARIMAGLPDVFDDAAPALASHAIDPALVSWFAERVERVPEARTPSMWLFNDYCQWAIRRGEEAMSMTAFGRRLTAMGIRGLNSNGIKRLGVRLRTVEVP